MIQICDDVNQIDLYQWNKLLEKSVKASFFQSQQCYDFYASLSFMEPFVFGVSENDILKGIVVGYIQKDGGKVKQFFSRRAIVIGGPLLADDISDKALISLLSSVKKQLKDRTIYIETRNFNDYSMFRALFVQCGFQYQEHLNFHVDCSDEAVMNKNMSSSKIRQVKKALKNGAEIIEAVTEEDVLAYYKLLRELYEEKIKTPLFPESFFVEFFNKKGGKYLLIKYNGNIIGGIMCPILANKVIYEWFVVGKDQEYKDLYPSILATWAAMDFAAKNNIPRFDLMGAGKPDEGYGVRDFKAKFGGKLVEHGRFLCVTRPLLFRIGKLGVKLLKARK